MNLSIYLTSSEEQRVVGDLRGWRSSLLVEKFLPFLGIVVLLRHGLHLWSEGGCGDDLVPGWGGGENGKKKGSKQCDVHAVGPVAQESPCPVRWPIIGNRAGWPAALGGYATETLVLWMSGNQAMPSLTMRWRRT